MATYKPMYPDVDLGLYNQWEQLALTAADKEYCHIIMDIIAGNNSDEKSVVRPRWHDGTPAHTKKIFGRVSRYNLGVSFPIMNLRKINYKLAFEEVLWIYQKASNKLSDLNGHIWDDWDVGDGTIGKGYGYQIAKKTDYKDGMGPMNQMERVLYDLCVSPASRSIQTNMYNHEDLPDMGLRPCAYNMNYNVVPTENGPVLNGMLIQRSQDMVTANNWNVVQYAALLTLVGHATGLRVGEFVHVIIDAHLYDRHEALAKEMVNAAVGRGHFQVSDYVSASFDLPIGNGTYEDACKIFYSAKPESLVLTGYHPYDIKPKIEVAV